jgi:hypothetical protein
MKELTTFDVVKALSPTRMDDPKQRELIWCVIYNEAMKSKNLKKGKEIIHEVAMMSPNITEEDVENFLGNINKRKHKKTSIGNISKFLKEDNEALYNALVKQLYSVEAQWEKKLGTGTGNGTGTGCVFRKIREYEDVKEEFEKEVFKIRTTAEFGYYKLDKLHIHSKTQLSVAFEELKYEYRDIKLSGRIKIEKAKFLPEWYEDANKRMYEAIDLLPPPLVCPDCVYNMWEGFAIEKEDVEAKNCDRILELVKVLCKHNMEAYEYLLDFLAHMLQFPAYPPGVCILLQSDPGSGKNTLIEIMKKIMGNKYVGETADPIRDLFSTHANVHIGKFLTNMDEAENSDTCKTMGRLKNLITAPTCNYNEKMEKIKPVRNCNRFIFTTNRDIPITIVDGAKDRRFCPIKCSDEWCKNKPFWSDFYKTVVNDMGVIKGFYNFLMERDVSERDWMSFPHTELRDDLIKASQHPIYEFFEELLCHEDYISEHKITMTPTNLFKKYQDYCMDRKITCNGNANGFGMIFKNKIKFEQAGIERPRSKKERSYIIDKYMAFEWLVKNEYNMRDELPGPKFIKI